MSNYSERVAAAASEWQTARRHVYRYLVSNGDGYYYPHEPCVLCAGARWISSNGAHLKSVRHWAALFEVEPKDVERFDRGMLPAPSPRTGDVVYKALRVDYNENGSMYLHSPRSHLDVWNVDEVFEAQCPAFQPCNDVPEPHCHCGIYAFWDIGDAIDYLSLIHI